MSRLLHWLLERPRRRPVPAKADDGWVLAEGHKLPDDLDLGDEIRELYRIEPKTDASDYGELISVHYRRRSPAGGRAG